MADLLLILLILRSVIEPLVYVGSLDLLVLCLGYLIRVQTVRLRFSLLTVLLLRLDQGQSVLPDLFCTKWMWVAVLPTVHVFLYLRVEMTVILLNLLSCLS
jgi:hypothetical protein